MSKIKVKQYKYIICFALETKDTILREEIISETEILNLSDYDTIEKDLQPRFSGRVRITGIQFIGFYIDDKVIKQTPA